MTHVEESGDVRLDGETRPALYEVTASVVFVLGFLTIAGAWFFEIVLGLQPCPLCLTQRIPYYVGVPLSGLLALVAWEGLRWANNPALRDSWQRLRPILLRGGLAVVSLVFAVGAGLGVYHSGVEWGLWAGPAGCSGQDTVPQSVDALLGALQEVRVVACNEAPWVFLGLSLAGWNALVSALLSIIALRGALAAPRPFKPSVPFYY